jgi:lambda family phage portal protein
MRWPFSKKPKKRIKAGAGYDVSNTNRTNSEYYSSATNLSGDQAANQSTRTVLRNRARYEYRNNSYFKAMNDGRAEDVVGRGPRLQINMLEDENLATAMENTWLGWSRAINLPMKLKMAEMEVGSAGEVFIVVYNNPMVKHPIKLDIMLVEAERVTTPTSKSAIETPTYVDGITYDTAGNPISYDIMTDHPGNGFFVDGSGDDFRTFPASSVYHWFDMERPSMHRGVPAITSGLQLFGFLRRYTQSVVLASETAADNAYMLQNSGTADADEVDIAEAFDEVPISMGTATVVPYGYEAIQMKPEQPTNTFKEFKRELVVEVGRSMRLPANVSLGDSSGYNYASGRLDKQEYHKTITDRQNQMGIRVLDGIFFDHWLVEASLLPSLFRLSLQRASVIRATAANEWYWDGFEHVDPVKEANAQDTRLNNGMTTYKDQYGKEGKDWTEQFAQRAAEKKAMEELGLTMSDLAVKEEDTEEIEDGEEE